MRFVCTGPRLDKGSRSSGSRGSSSTTTEWVLMPTKGGKGNPLSLSSYIVLPLPFAACTCLPYPCQLSCCALPGSGLVWFTSNNWQHHTSTTFVPALSSPSLCLSFYTRFANCFAQISMQSVELFTLLLSSILQSFNHVSFASLCFCLFNSKAKSWARFSRVSIFLCSLSCKRAENKIVGDYERSFRRFFSANWKRN